MANKYFLHSKYFGAININIEIILTYKLCFVNSYLIFGMKKYCQQFVHPVKQTFRGSLMIHLCQEKLAATLWPPFNKNKFARHLRKIFRPKNWLQFKIARLLKRRKYAIYYEFKSPPFSLYIRLGEQAEVYRTTTHGRQNWECCDTKVRALIFVLEMFCAWKVLPADFFGRGLGRLR